MKFLKKDTKNVFWRSGSMLISWSWTVVVILIQSIAYTPNREKKYSYTLNLCCGDSETI